MTVDKFNQAAEHYQQRSLIGFGWATLFAIATVAVCMGLASILDLPQWLGEPAAEVISGLSPFPGFLVFFGFFWYWDRRLLADSRLRCPHCEKTIAIQKHLVVATRNCPYCGLKVLEEPVAPTIRHAELELDR